MDRIKTAYEKAMEKIEQMGEASEEELMRLKYVPEGEKLAADYLKEESNIVTELNKYQAEARKYVAKGAEAILLRYIELPRNEVAKRTTKRAMEGIKALKKDKAALANIYTQMRRIFSHYEEQGEQQRGQVYQNLRSEFEANLRQALQQQMGPLTARDMRLNVESHPQFQTEWRKALAQLDSQYVKLLDEYKQEIARIP